MKGILNSIKGLFVKEEAQAPMESTGAVTLLHPRDDAKKVVAVIVSFVHGATYDNLFTSVQQQAEEGTQVLTYGATSDSVGAILRAFQGECDNEVIKQMVAYIKELDSDCVVFNWECSSGYSEGTFTQGRNQVFTFIDQMLKRGHMLMFSDFSLKALIRQWKEDVLGPNPFIKINQFSGNFEISFEAHTLRDCPSAQLQIIGQMAAEGHCKVHAMGGTIVYGVKKEHKNQTYDLQILTVASSINTETKYRCSVGNKSGAAGHVLLKYKKGGFILTSMGHWIQLMKIDTSEQVLFEVAQKQYGGAYVERMKQEYSDLPEMEKSAWRTKNAVQFVQKQAPCTNMSRKRR